MRCRRGNRPADLVASMPPISPGARPGRSAMEKAMKPDSTGTMMREGGAAADLHQRRRQRSLLFDRIDAEDEGQGYRQTAGDDDRQHVGHAGHQVLVGSGSLSAAAPFGAAAGAPGRLRAAPGGAGFRERVVDDAAAPA